MDRFLDFFLALVGIAIGVIGVVCLITSQDVRTSLLGLGCFLFVIMWQLAGLSFNLRAQNDWLALIAKQQDADD